MLPDLEFESSVHILNGLVNRVRHYGLMTLYFFTFIILEGNSIRTWTNHSNPEFKSRPCLFVHYYIIISLYFYLFFASFDASFLDNFPFFHHNYFINLLFRLTVLSCMFEHGYLYVKWSLARHNPRNMYPIKSTKMAALQTLPLLQPCLVWVLI